MVYKLHSSLLLKQLIDIDEVEMNPNHQPIRIKLAIGIAFLDVFMIFITLIRYVPILMAAVEPPFSQLLRDARVWSILAELLFYWAILVVLYGLISLWLPELRFILWTGVALGVVAGLIYVLAGVMYYQCHGMGAPIQQGGFMFLLSASAPFLMYKLLKRTSRKVQPEY